MAQAWIRPNATGKETKLFYLIILGVVFLVVLPILTIVAYVRTRRIRGLEDQVNLLQRQMQALRKMQDAAQATPPRRSLSGEVSVKADAVPKVEQPLAEHPTPLPSAELRSATAQPPVAAASTEEVVTHCPDCGLRVDENQMICPACHYRIDRVSPPVVGEPASATSLAESPPTTTAQPSPEQDVAVPGVAESPEPPIFIDDSAVVQKLIESPISAGTVATTDETCEARPSKFESPLPSPTFSERLAKYLTNEELEALVGGSLLNKIGVLVLVIGIALFIGYSIANLGAAGRIAVGYVVSGGLLVSGIGFERRSRYRTFARGLMAGGWAGVYFTTFATYGIEASKIINSPYVATSLLISVAAGMIVHSLFYQAQQITTLAYLFAFLAIAISPVSTYSGIASVPLVVSLGLVSFRWSWIRLAVAGILSAYGIWLVRLGLGSGETTLVAGQSVLAAYWLTFEILDWALLWKRVEDKERPILFPLNSIGFLGVSLLLWDQFEPENLFWFLAASGIVFLVSGLVRAAVRPPESYDSIGNPAGKVLAGGYELSATLSAVLFAAAIWQRLDGMAVNFAWLLEAECLFLVGLMLRQKYLQGLAAAIVTLPVCKLFADMVAGERIQWQGWTFLDWTPVALLTIALLYTNRGLVGRVPSQRGLGIESVYTSVATLLAVILCFHEVPAHLFAIVVLALGLILFEVGYQLRVVEFRIHGYLVVAFAFGWMVAINGLQIRVPEAEAGSLKWWIWMLPAMLGSFLTSWRMATATPRSLPSQERKSVKNLLLSAGNVLYGFLVWHALPAPLVSLGWAAGGLLLWELGRHRRLAWPRANGHVLILLGVAWLFFANFTNPGMTAGISHRLLTVAPMILLVYYLASSGRTLQGDVRLWDRNMAALYLWLGSLLVVLLMRFELGRVLAVVGWALFMVGLLWTGLRKQVRDLRWQSYVVAVLTFVRSWATNFVMPASLAGIFGRVVTGSIVIVCYYASQYLTARSPAPDREQVPDSWIAKRLDQFDIHARWLFCLLGSALLAVLLAFELPGNPGTCAWGLQAILLLALGWWMMERPLAACSVGLLIASVAKLVVDQWQGSGEEWRIAGYAAVIAGFLMAHFVIDRSGLLRVSPSTPQIQSVVSLLDRSARWIYGLAAIILLTVLIAFESSGRLLTVAWGIEGTVLLVAGFLIRDRVFRLSGLGLMAICVLKLFVLDLRGLDTPYRIASFVLLGLLMIAVSWIYTRYREQIRQHI